MKAQLRLASKTRQKRIQFRHTPGEFGLTVYLRDLRDLRDPHRYRSPFRSRRRRSAKKICLCKKKAVVQVRLSAIVMTVQRSSRLRGGSVPSFLALPAKSPIGSRSSRRIVFSPGVEIAACCRVVMHGNQARRERCDSRRRRIGDFFWHLMIFLGISLNRCRAISAAVYEPCPYITHACRRPGADNPARYRG